MGSHEQMLGPPLALILYWRANLPISWKEKAKPRAGGMIPEVTWSEGSGLASQAQCRAP